MASVPFHLASVKFNICNAEDMWLTAGLVILWIVGAPTLSIKRKWRDALEFGKYSLYVRFMHGYSCKVSFLACLVWSEFLEFQDRDGSYDVCQKGVLIGHHQLYAFPAWKTTPCRSHEAQLKPHNASIAPVAAMAIQSFQQFHFCSSGLVATWMAAAAHWQRGGS